MLKMNLEYKKGILFVRLKGNLNNNTSKSFNDYLLPILKNYNIKNVVINLKKLEEMDMTGCDTIINTSNLVKNNNGNVLIIDNHNYQFNNELLSIRYV